MAHAVLLRTTTAPALTPTSNGVGGLKKMSVPRSSHLSAATTFAAGSSTSLNSLNTNATVLPPNGGSIVATANIINQKADASRSLYQICVSLKQRLAQVPDFQPFLDQLDPTDPVDSLWNLFRSGHPLLIIYNCLEPGEPLKVDVPGASEAKKSKIAIFKFVQACMKELRLPPGDTFVITDLMGDDTSGFVKVTQVVNYVLDLAEQNGHLLKRQLYPEQDSSAPAPDTQMSYRDHIVKELVDTERKYVQDLENLHDLKKRLEQKGHVPGDIVHQIFLNINAILDFQRRFLIRVETTNSMPKDDQRWGAPFCFYEGAFDIYQPFIANQRKAAQIANQVFDKIQLSEHPVAADFNTLDGFLLKPMQRLVKYPLLLKDLKKKTDDLVVKHDLQIGCDAAERVLHKANDAVHRDLLDEALEELMVRVDDWKSHRIEQFGRLLLHGIYGVVTGKTEQEKDYEIYLFENILLCCKEVSSSKTKDKKDKTRSLGPKIKNKNAKLQLKGRIFMTNVTDVVSLSRPGSHSVQIWWKGDPGVENFTIKFVHEEMMRTWEGHLDTQRKVNAPRASLGSSDANSQDFTWTRDHGLENPYLQQDDDDDDDDDHDYGPATAPAQFPAPPGTLMARTSSGTSVRQRSMTGDSTQSLASLVRAPPPRFPMSLNPASLNVQTGGNNGGASSPGARAGDSYFSPTAESPVSSRASTTSGVFPFPNKYGSFSSAAWDENARYTAPAMPRASSRDSHSSSYTKPSRGPSLPPMASNSGSTQQRSRSYSTPDSGMPGLARQRHPSQSNIPAVPGIPQHLHENGISRSQNSSPRNDLPLRTNSSSPGSSRQNMHKHSGSLSGTMSSFQGSHTRQNTLGGQVSSGLRVDAAVANIRYAPPSLPSGSLGASSGASYNGAGAGADMPLPTQLKVRVNCDSGNYVTLVVAFNISYQSLIDRIDAKLARFMTCSIGRGGLKLRYRDEDGDFVTIESDDDIQIAFSEWREGVRNMYSGGVGEIELFCVGDTC